MKITSALNICSKKVGNCFKPTLNKTQSYQPSHSFKCNHMLLHARLNARLAFKSATRIYSWTHIVSDVKEGNHLGRHVSGLHGHEESVEHDAEGDEQVDEGIHDEGLDGVREGIPLREAVPVEQQLFHLHPQPLKLCQILVIRQAFAQHHQVCAFSGGISMHPSLEGINGLIYISAVF